MLSRRVQAEGLTLAIDVSEDVPLDEPPVAPDAGRAAGLRVLVAEDNEVNRLVAVRLLG